MKIFEKTIENVKKLSGSKRERAEALVDKVVFMEEELGKLQERLKVNGWTEEYQNGANQFGIKKSSDGDVYNSLIKNYNAAMKTLDDLLASVQDEVDDIEAKYFG